MGDAAYNIHASLQLRGELDEGALRSAVGEIMRRHEVLRTRFPEVDGVAYQEVQPAAEP
ncbi:MAG: condensation domain-containing protein, partial [Solirubrobacteraceae bacterium]